MSEATGAERAAAVAALNAIFGPASEHADHRWRQVGRCVYCECGERLYQGTIPKGHPTFAPPRRPSEADKMRDRWNMDARPRSTHDG